MKTRHRMPTIFSIYMVDVLCCALGCVILLWLINFREVKQRTAAASETGKRLSETRLALDSSQTDLASLRRALADARKQQKDTASRLGTMQGERDQLQKLLSSAHKQQSETRLVLKLSEQQLAALRNQFKELQDKSADTSRDLELKDAELGALLKKLNSVERKTQTLTKELDVRDALLKEADAASVLLAKQLRDLKLLADDYESKLARTELRARRTEKDLTKSKKDVLDAKKLYEELLLAQELLSRRLTLSAGDLKTTQANLADVDKAYKTKLALAESRSRLLEDDLQKGKKELLVTRKLYEDMLAAQDALAKRALLSAKDLKAAQELIDGLKDQKLTLQQQIQLIRQAAERRFAGIALTGENVLFLVDMSGSMELTDENTPDPDKWPLVCETVAKIMESLVDLKQYQVMLFSDKVRYPLGNDSRWQRYNPETTPKSVLSALKAIKPNGETNMAAVFDEAFRFRAQGLDTIYVLSDGLPNAGPGLPPTSQNLTENQKTEVLSKYVRNRLKYVLNGSIPGQQRVRINTIGFFFESPEVGAFLWALAREHSGSFVGMSK